MGNKILIPVDYSDQSLIALEQACNLAKVINASITLLNIIDEEPMFMKVFSQEQSENIRKGFQTKLDKLAEESAKKTGLHFDTLISKGKVYEKIVEISELINATIIVMGANESSGFKKKFIGSNTLRVVRESKIPVITIKGRQHRKGCKNIVLPLDLTKETKEKVAKAIEFARYFGSTIRVVSVLLTSDEFIINRLTRQMDQVKKYIEKEGIECAAEIIKGTKGKESLTQCILDYSNKVKGDLVMIMTQQEVDFTELFIGSAAQEIINHSEIPVMSIIPIIRKDTSVFKPY